VDQFKSFLVESYKYTHTPDDSNYPNVHFKPSGNCLSDNVILVKIANLSLNELAVQRGARVEATDGPVGVVDDLVVAPETGRITHLVLREGHPWGQKEVMIPVTDVADAEKNVVHLTLDKQAIAALPTTPAQPPLRPIPPQPARPSLPPRPV
jgi:sporulation protein YlmC with PRC-barrel domain